MKNKLIIGMLLATVLVFTACQKSDTIGVDKITNLELTPNQIDQISLMKEVSIATATFNITTAPKSKLRYNNELSRRGVLSNVVRHNILIKNS